VLPVWTNIRICRRARSAERTHLATMTVRSGRRRLPGRLFVSRAWEPWHAALPPVRWRGGVVNQTSDLLNVRAAYGPAELPQLTGRPVILVQRRVHLLGVAISAVTIQRDADMFDEFVQARLVVRSDTFLRLTVGAAHGSTLTQTHRSAPARVQRNARICRDDARPNLPMSGR
jgi:hypothetical protein